MRTVPVLAAVGLLAAASPAPAGPIIWTYDIEVEYAEDYGSRYEVDLARDWFVRHLPGVPAGISLFFPIKAPAPPEPGSHEVRYDFTFRVTITDEASDEFETFSFPGFYESAWSYLPEDRDHPDRWQLVSEASGFGDPSQLLTVTLGQNVYEVRAFDAFPGRYPGGDMLVDVHPLSTAAPEPGTLALAGVGLGAVGLLGARRRRRGRPTSAD